MLWFFSRFHYPPDPGHSGLLLLLAWFDASESVSDLSGEANRVLVFKEKGQLEIKMLTRGLP